MESIFLSSADMAAATANLSLSTSASRAPGVVAVATTPALAVILPPAPRVMVFAVLAALVMDSE